MADSDAKPKLSEQDITGLKFLDQLAPLLQRLPAELHTAPYLPAFGRLAWTRQRRRSSILAGNATKSLSNDRAEHYWLRPLCSTPAYDILINGQVVAGCRPTDSGPTLLNLGGPYTVNVAAEVIILPPDR